MWSRRSHAEPRARRVTIRVLVVGLSPQSNEEWASSHADLEAAFRAPATPEHSPESSVPASTRP